MKVPCSRADILKLIPQREPIVMVSGLHEIDENHALTSLLVEQDNFFLRANKLLATGLIEHIAQSAAAFVGYHSQKGENEPHIGYIGEVKQAQFGDMPSVGEQIFTRLSPIAQIDNVTLFEAQSAVNERVIASCQIKVFLR